MCNCVQYASQNDALIVSRSSVKPFALCNGVAVCFCEVGVWFLRITGLNFRLHRVIPTESRLSVVLEQNINIRFPP